MKQSSLEVGYKNVLFYHMRQIHLLRAWGLNAFNLRINYRWAEYLHSTTILDKNNNAQIDAFCIKKSILK